MIDIEAGETAGSEDIRPNPAILIGGAAAIGLCIFLPHLRAH